LNPLPSNFTAHPNNQTNNSLQVSNEKELVNFRDEIDLKQKCNLLDIMQKPVTETLKAADPSILSFFPLFNLQFLVFLEEFFLLLIVETSLLIRNFFVFFLLKISSFFFCIF
jgi:hypothetical protein